MFKSSLSRAIQEAEEFIHPHKKPSGLKRLLRTIVYFVIDLYQDYPERWYYSAKHFIRNVKFFWPHILHMKDFDSSYQINLFCDSLEYLARGLARWDNALLSKRNSRRCFRAAAQLRKAYEYGIHKDKSAQALADANPIKWIPLKSGMSQMSHDYKKTPDYYNKMFKIITRRTADVEKRQKREAWAYIEKYISHWWD